MNQNASWRDDPNIMRRLSPEYPDELQVVVHDGGPRLTGAQPELMWVTINGKNGVVYEGTLLNEPVSLASVALHSQIWFLAPDGVEHPFRVTEKYLAERANWNIMPCDKCGMPELFDAPSDLMRAIFPGAPADATVEGFTSFVRCAAAFRSSNFGAQARANRLSRNANGGNWAEQIMKTAKAILEEFYDLTESGCAFDLKNGWHHEGYMILIEDAHIVFAESGPMAPDEDVSIPIDEVDLATLAYWDNAVRCLMNARWDEAEER